MSTLAPNETVCPSCNTSQLRTKRSRDHRKSDWLDTGARKWVEWESRHKGSVPPEWIAEQVNKAHGTAFGRRWVSQNLKEIQKRSGATQCRKQDSVTGCTSARTEAGWWASWIDASGRRPRRRARCCDPATGAHASECRGRARADELKTKGYAAPVADSFGLVLDRYLKYQKPRLSHGSYERTRGIVEGHLRPCFGRLRIGDVRRTDIQDYITRRAGEAAPGTAIKETNILKHLLGLVEWELIPFNPATKVKAPRPPAGRVRCLGSGELRTFIDACPDWLRPIVILAAFTGMRRGEILGLRWMHVDLSGGRLMLPQTKNGDGRIVHLNGYSRQAILSQWVRMRVPRIGCSGSPTIALPTISARDS